MPQVDKATIKNRAMQLRAAGKIAMGKFLGSRVGSRASVLMEDGGIGNSEHFVPVRVSPGYEPGTLIDVTIASATDVQLIAA